MLHNIDKNKNADIAMNKLSMSDFYFSIVTR